MGLAQSGKAIVHALYVTFDRYVVVSLHGTKVTNASLALKTCQNGRWDCFI
jgi:hypothetical protein